MSARSELIRRRSEIDDPIHSSCRRESTPVDEGTGVRNVYGPRQHTQGAYAQIVPRWYDLMSTERPITIFGDGSQTMDMTFVQDVARANVLAAKSGATADFFNVGTGTATSVLEVFQYMKKLLGYDLSPGFDRRDVNLVKRRQCSTEKAEQALGFKAEFAVKDGLQKYIEWREQIAGSESLVLAANVR